MRMAPKSGHDVEQETGGVKEMGDPICPPFRLKDALNKSAFD